MGSSLQQGQEPWSKVRPNIPPADQILSPELEKLRGSNFDTPEDLVAFSRRFDEGVKRVFSNSRTAQYVKFGSPRDNDPKCGIKGGRLTLTG